MSSEKETSAFWAGVFICLLFIVVTAGSFIGGFVLAAKTCSMEEVTHGN